MDEFPCRTKSISETDYSIIVYSVPENEKVASISYFFSEEQAQTYIDRMPKTDNRRFEIVSRTYTREVCIECGKDENW